MAGEEIEQEALVKPGVGAAPKAGKKKPPKFEEMPLVELISGKKTSRTTAEASKILVCPSQYLYAKNKETLKENGDLTTRWRCRLHPACRTTATTVTRGGDLNTGVTRLFRSEPHPSHFPDTGEVVRLRSKEAVLELSKEHREVKPRELYSAMNVHLENHGEVNTVKKNTLDRQVQRLRMGAKKAFDPATFEEVCQNLPAELRLTSEGSRFVLFCGTIDDTTPEEDLEDGSSEEDEDGEEQGVEEEVVEKMADIDEVGEKTVEAEEVVAEKMDEAEEVVAGQAVEGQVDEEDGAGSAKKKKKGPAGLIVMASQQGIDRLSMARLWMSDGNAKLAKAPFSQVYIILAAAPSGRLIPSVWTLMTARTTASYKKMYSVLKQAVGAVKPSKIVLDMEVAAYKAWLAVFFIEGNRTAVTFCLFHWRRALTRNLGKYRCKEEFYKKGPANKLFRRLSCLPMVPAEHIVLVAEDLLSTFMKDHLENISHAACGFLDYFRKNFIGVFDKKKNQRKAATYPPHLWSIYNSVLNKEPHTTNYAEGYNNGSGHNLSRHATLEDALTFYQSEESKAMGDWRLACREDVNSFDSTKMANSKKAAKKNKALCNILATFHLYKPGKYGEYLDQVYSV